MNPLVLLGLGAVAVIAMGKKKATPSKEESGGEDEGLKPIVFQKLDVNLGKKTMVAMPPLDYSAQINQRAPLEAKQCHLQGMNNPEQITGCIAPKLFPTWSWPISNKSQPWQKDAWSRMKNIARMELGMDPIIT